MESTVIKEEMLQYFSRLNITEQESVLNLLKTFANNKHDDFYPVTLEEYSLELDEADKAIEQGDYVTHEEVKKHYLK